MSSPHHPGHWQPPTAAYPVPPKKRPVWKIVLWSTLAAVALCFGGSLTIGLIIGPPDGPAGTEPAAQEQAAQPLLAATSGSPTPAATAASPAAVATTAAPRRVATTPPARRTTAAAKRPAPKPTTPRPTPRPTTKKPTPRPKPTTRPPAATVHPGAFCAPRGAIGYTSAGTRMRCTLKAGEDRARWRRA